MDVAYISALSALAGSAIGGLIIRPSEYRGIPRAVSPLRITPDILQRYA
jgi:hypothetical protein